MALTLNRVIKALLQGKAIRRAGWCPGEYIYASLGLFGDLYDEAGNITMLDGIDLLAADWELYDAALTVGYNEPCDDRR